jgi:hypothetical protein
VIVGALHPDFVLEMEEELDKRSSGGFRPLYGTDAPDLRNLLRLLLKESETGGPCGTLYADSLMTALATRLLYAVRSEKASATNRISPFTTPAAPACAGTHAGQAEREFRPCDTRR